MNIITKARILLHLLVMFIRKNGVVIGEALYRVANYAANVTYNIAN